VNDNRPLTFDWLLFTLVLLLSGLGLIMLLSSSFFVAQYRFGDGYYYFTYQLRNLIIGFILMLTLARIPYQFWQKWAYPVLLTSLLLLAIVHIPGLGMANNPAKRWISLAGFSFQPSEASKLAMVIYMAYSLSRKGERVGSFVYGLLPHLIFLGVLASLILAGSDLGTAACVVAIAITMMLVAGTKFWHLGLLSLSASSFVYLSIVNVGYRMGRIKAFLDPWAYSAKEGYQIIHSFYAFASGGWLGRGPGLGQQKLFFLPEAHNDFIFSVVAEEFGLVGVAVISLVFLILVFRGLSISRTAPDFFGLYLALGCTLIVGLPAFFNMCVVTGLLPNKGLPLPFFSYGGTSLLVCFVAMGLLLNVAGQSSGGRPESSKKRNLALKASRFQAQAG
jgi:cell division protein FtsW